MDILLGERKGVVRDIKVICSFILLNISPLI